MRIVFLAVALASACLFSTPVLAWGPIGHRVSGAIATDHLTRKARHAIEEILGDETLAEASTYADEMRPSPDPFWKSEAGPYHYVTVPTGKTYTDVGAPPEGDAVAALATFASIVKDNAAPLADRQRALRFIAHLVGDLHMPLHAGNGTDRGGNDFKVTTFGEPASLHYVWDETLIVRRQLSYTEMADFLRRRITPEKVEAWSNPDPLVWIAESVALRDTIYPAGDTPETRLVNYDYEFKHRSEVDERLCQGGVRLAAYLNALFR